MRGCAPSPHACLLAPPPTRDRLRLRRKLRPRCLPLPAVVPAGFTPFELPEVVAGETFLSSLTRSLWGRVAVLAVSGLLGLAGVLAVWTVVSNRQHAADPKPNDENAKAAAAAPAPADSGAKPALPLAQFNRRWLPEQTLLLIDLRLSRLVETAAGDGRVGAFWVLGGNRRARRYCSVSTWGRSKSAA